MKKNFLYFLLITALSTFTFIACGGDDDDDPIDDLEKPSITISSPEEGDKYKNDGNENISIAVKLEDNIQLDTCYISVYYSGGSNEEGALNFEKGYKLSGTSYDIAEEVEINSGVKVGTYTLSITVEDEAGNKETKTIGFSILVGEDTEKPTISLTTPQEDKEYENNGTDAATIYLNGTLEDNVALDSCHVSVAYSGAESASSLKGTDDPTPFDKEKGYSLEGAGTSYTFEDEDPFGSIVNATPGEYTFTIEVFDTAGNKAEDSFTINIKEPATE